MYLNPLLNTLSILILIVLPSSLHSFEEMSNLTNIIDRRRSLSGPSYEDQSVDEYISSSPETSPGPGTGTGTGTGSCNMCRLREEVRTKSLQHIKNQILTGLGMQNVNITGRKFPQVPQDVLAQYPNLVLPGMMSDQPQPSAKAGSYIVEEEDNLHIKTEKVVVFSKPYPKIRHGARVQGVQYFHFSDKVTRHRVKVAHLFVWVRGSGDARPPTTNIEIQVHKVLRDTGKPDAPLLQQRGHTVVRQYSGDGRWVKVDATVMVSEWFKNTKENYGFVINSTMLNGQRIVVSDNSVEGGDHMPFVDIETADGRKRRTKRTLSLHCNENEEEKLCCRYPMTVDFVEFGWDFIIAPKKYEANYCAGECPYLTMQRHVHTQLMMMSNPAVNPCCTARKMSAISMLYFDQDMNIIIGHLPGMVIDRCGCS